MTAPAAAAIGSPLDVHTPHIYIAAHIIGIHIHAWGNLRRMNLNKNKRGGITPPRCLDLANIICAPVNTPTSESIPCNTPPRMAPKIDRLGNNPTQCWT